MTQTQSGVPAADQGALGVSVPAERSVEPGSLVPGTSRDQAVLVGPVWGATLCG